MEFIHKKFANQNIEADGKKFFDCEFTNCGFLYSGGTIPIFCRCKLSDDCYFEFADCAGNTINLLQTLCKDPFFGPTTRANLENFVRQARTGDFLH
ncbi:MAG TPA: hypothetical protein VN667_22095 [Burkholderiales bacterium]|nr:hypothetical protein [Burkholderiales bacterium]